MTRSLRLTAAALAAMTMTVGAAATAATAATAAAAAAAAAAGAAPAQADEFFPYEVRQGDSLYVIAERLLEDARRWPEVAKLNRLTRPSRLQPGQRLLLPAALLKGTARPARAEYVRGPVRAGGAPLRIGDEVGEGAELEVGAQGFVSLRLHDGSLLQLQANSRSKLLRLRDLPVGQRRNTLVELDAGRVDATVSPQTGGSRFEVKTPLATAGVRGTRFGVSVPVDARMTTADVVEGRVAVDAASSMRTSPKGRAPSTGPGSSASDSKTTALGATTRDGVLIAAGEGAVVRPGVAPSRKALLPAPAVWHSPLRVERLPGALPLPEVDGAARYRVEVADDETFTRVVWSAEGPAPISVDGLPDGRYRLRARAIDADGLLGAEGSGTLWIKTTPVPPLARAPQADEIVGPEHVTIDCTEVPGAAAYLLQVSAHADFSVPLHEAQARERCRFQLSDLPAGELHWRVASQAPEPDGHLERGPFSDPSRFVVVPLPPVPKAEDLIADAQGLHWQAQPGYRYRVQVATDTGFATIVQDEEVGAGALRLTMPARCAPYAVHLQAIDPHGRRSAFSAPRLINGEASVCSGDGAPVQSGGEHVRTAG